MTEKSEIQEEAEEVVEEVEQVPAEELDVEEAEDEAADSEVEEVVEAETPPVEVKEVEDKLLRLRADFDNFRKRTQREKEQWSALALENLVTDLLMVLDHFELGLKNADEHEAKPAVAEGFRLVYDQMNQALKKHKVDEIEAEGKAFDPEVHEAISTLPSEDIEHGHVAFVARRGFILGTKVIRPAQVVVSSGPADAGEEKAEG